MIIAAVTRMNTVTHSRAVAIEHREAIEQMDVVLRPCPAQSACRAVGRCRRSAAEPAPLPDAVRIVVDDRGAPDAVGSNIDALLDSG